MLSRSRKRQVLHTLQWVAALAIPVALLSAQGPPTLADGGAVHAGTFRPANFPGGGLAPGMIVALFGEDFHTGAPVAGETLPLPVRLGELATGVIVNGAIDCPLFFVSEGQINCQLPHGLTGATVRIKVVTNQGESAEIELPLHPAMPGMFTANRNGRGAAAASNIVADGDMAGAFRRHGADAPVRAGQPLALWCTGLGNTEPPIPAGEPASGPAPAVQQPRVFVGDVEAQVLYAGRAPGFAGLDQINIVVPEDAPLGCAVPVRVEAEQGVGHIGTISVGDDETHCHGPVEDVVSGLSHGSVVLASGLGRLGPGQLGPGAMPGGPFPHDDDHGPGGGPGPGGMGPSQMNGHQGNGPGGGVGPGPGGVGSDGIGGFGLHPGIHPHSGGPDGQAMGLGTDVVTARFVRLASDAEMDVMMPPAASDSCSSFFQPRNEIADMFWGPMEFLDAGELTLQGPGVSLMLGGIEVGAGTLYAEALPTPLEQGTYTVAGQGGSDVGVFGPVDLTVPALLDVTTSLEAGTTVSRADGLTLSWTGGAADDVVVIHGRAFAIPEDAERPLREPMGFHSQAFLCSTTAGDGEFSIPAYVLGSLPDGLLTLNITHMPGEEGIARFEAEGLDEGGVFRWVDTTAFLDLELGP